jgi:Uncharacterized protein conserved in bacteria (DUF2188)
MQLDRYLVLPVDDRWAVQLERSILGVFSQKGEAIQAAITVAVSSGRYGTQAEVLTQGPDGEFTPIWTFGLDGYSAEA